MYKEVLCIMKYYQLVYIGIVSYSRIFDFPIQEFHYLFAVRLISCFLSKKYSYQLVKYI